MANTTEIRPDNGAHEQEKRQARPPFYSEFVGEIQSSALLALHNVSYALRNPVSVENPTHTVRRSLEKNADGVPILSFDFIPTGQERASILIEFAADGMILKRGDVHNIRFGVDDKCGMMKDAPTFEGNPSDQAQIALNKVKTAFGKIGAVEVLDKFYPYSELSKEELGALGQTYTIVLRLTELARIKDQERAGIPDLAERVMRDYYDHRIRNPAVRLFFNRGVIERGGDNLQILFPHPVDDQQTRLHASGTNRGGVLIQGEFSSIKDVAFGGERTWTAPNEAGELVIMQAAGGFLVEEDAIEYVITYNKEGVMITNLTDGNGRFIRFGQQPPRVPSINELLNRPY